MTPNVAPAPLSWESKRSPAALRWLFMDGLVRGGGAQVIPRPANARPGGPPPWHGIVDPRIDLGRLRTLLEPTLLAPDAVDVPEGEIERPAAVLAPLYERDGRVEVVLTRRALHLRRHRGEVSFPGGRLEPHDSGLVAAALREAQEEISLAPTHVEVLGGLQPLRTLSARSFIMPFVGVLSKRPELRPDPAEVDHILHVPLDVLLTDGVYREELWGPPGLERTISFFEISGDTIWGATASMLRDLLARIVTTEPGPGHRR